jgi:hypothetical protein
VTDRRAQFAPRLMGPLSGTRSGLWVRFVGRRLYESGLGVFAPGYHVSHELKDGGPINFWQCEKPNGAGVLSKICKGCDAAVITAGAVD